MKRIEGKGFDYERALYGSENVEAIRCRFEGKADGESAFKESKNLIINSCFFDLRYPFWHVNKMELSNSEMTINCRAPLWYTSDVKINACTINSVKALRECQNIEIENSTINSVEFGWRCDGVKMNHSKISGEYFMLMSKNLSVSDIDFSGKYSFQYIENATFENCNFDTKDAFWHAKNVYVKNCKVKGEYLGWYSENITFENCVITGTQPLCYAKGLKLINCEMHEADFSFEKSEVEAQITSHIISIKNPKLGKITAPSVDTIIKDDKEARAEIIIGEMATV